MSKLFSSLKKQFPFVDITNNHVIIGDSSNLYSILNGVFYTQTDNSYYKSSSESTYLHDLKVDIIPLIFNEEYVYFVLPYMNLHKFIKNVNKKIKKRCTNCNNVTKSEDRYFVCVKQGIAFVVTNDIHIISEVLFDYDDGDGKYDKVSKCHQTSLNNDDILENSVYFGKNLVKLSLPNDDIIVLNSFINEDKEIERVVFNHLYISNDKMIAKFEENVIFRTVKFIKNDRWIVYSSVEDENNNNILDGKFTVFYDKFERKGANE